MDSLNQEANTQRRKAREKARVDMRDDAPNNQYPFDSVEYWAYAGEVAKINDEYARSL